MGWPVDYDWLIRPQDATRLLYKRDWARTWERLLDAETLGRWARDRGGGFRPEDIHDLWRMRLLRADAVRARGILNRRLFLDAGHLGGHRIYADARLPLVSPAGLAGQAIYDQVGDATPLFHPFRLLVLRHLASAAQVSIGAIHFLRDPEALRRIVDGEIGVRRRGTAGESTTQRIARLNDIITVGVLLEPLLAHRIENPSEAESPPPLSHWSDVADPLHSLGKEAALEVHAQLCREGQLLDENRSIHTMLRLSLRRRDRSQMHLRGLLDGALELRLLAEAWRRGCEAAFKVRWREEDEVGLGDTPADVKEQLFDVPRLLDADDGVIADFMRFHFLEARPAVRIYCEGDTEVGFAKAYLDLAGVTGVALVPLRGHLGDPRGLASEIEQNDRESVFTYVLLDGDVGKHVSAVRGLADREDFAGGFLVSSPDFELANFTIEELAAAAVRLIVGAGANGAELTAKIVAAGPFKSAKEFASAARKIIGMNDGRSFKKGEAWGEALLAWADTHPHPSGCQRPAIELLRRAVHAPRTLYRRNKRRFQVDPSSGSSRPRVPADPGKA